MKKWFALAIAAFLLSGIFATFRGTAEYDNLSIMCDSWDRDCLEWAEWEATQLGMAAFGIFFVGGLGLGAGVIGLINAGARFSSHEGATESEPPRKRTASKEVGKTQP